MEAMTTMLKLLSTFSLAALFSLSIAGCAVDDPDGQDETSQTTRGEPLSPEAAERIREGLEVDQPKRPDALSPEAAERVREGLELEASKDSEWSDEKAQADFCTENDQCESNICDLRRHACVR
jgi:hypothetical protein